MRKRENIVILDFGSQYTQLIARRVRELKVHSEILPWDVAPEEITSRAPKGIILSGGPSSVREQGAPTMHRDLFGMDTPILGICYGMQVLAHLLDGEVARGRSAEYGRSTVRVVGKNLLFEGVPEEITVWMSHWDEVTRLPQGATLLAESEGGVPAAFAMPDGKTFAIQFHPEVVHTIKGTEILRNFLFGICGCSESWDLGAWIDETVEEIRAKTKEERIVCGLSGGVDSSVAATLVHRAVGDRLDCIFVDNGLLRLGEAAQVLDAYRNLHLRVHFVDAGERFLSALAGVTEPERKRKIIGEIFVRVFEETAERIGGATWLLQGTLYPDVIESGHKGKGAAVIKTHHNVGGLPEDMTLSVLEPLRDLFKDEVRAIGRMLGVPPAILGRHPFPGPGLAVRCLGDVTPERLAVLRKADAILIETLRKSGWYEQTWQALAVLLPVRSVGVVGDVRTYGEVVALRVVEAQDAMTADWARLPHDVLDETARRICNEVHGINRVVYDITGKPPATIEWE